MQYAQIAKQVIDNEIEALKKLESIFTNNFNNIINQILLTKGRVILTGIGKSGHIAKKIAASLASTGTPSFFVHPSEASHGDLGMITTDDIVLVISNSGETKEIFDIIEYCNSNKVDIIAITQNKTSTLGKASQYLIELPPHQEASKLSAPTTSSLMTLAVGDAITIALHEAQGITRQQYLSYHPGGKIGEILKEEL